tara:strand:+ start:61 stop:915 length:855 start_codon:yes stop_codon:yes gene_type:complete
MHIKRNELIAESLIRDHVRSRIKETLERKHLSEATIRQVVRKILIKEAETGTEEPSEYTGINVLANLLEKIIPIIEDDYKMLTTSVEQRESFRNHIVQAIKNSLRPLETVDDAEKKAITVPENQTFDIKLGELLSEIILQEKVVIDLDPQDDGEEEKSIEGEFIDIDADSKEDEFIEIDDQNETGRNFAATTYKQVEKQIVDAYDMLADEKDQTLFYDYLLTNMLLYFDKFEDELQASLPATTTPEYEKEKENTTDDAKEPEESTPDETAPAETATGDDDPFSD